MEKIRKTIYFGVILSEASHVFCCVLPTLFSVVSLLTGLGLVSAMPPVFYRLHEVLHEYELTMIVISALVLGLGWGLHRLSKQVDCHDTGCCHGPCAPQKDRVLTVLKIATGLFIFNLAVYLVFHRGLGIGLSS